MFLNLLKLSVCSQHRLHPILLYHVSAGGTEICFKIRTYELFQRNIKRTTTLYCSVSERSLYFSNPSKWTTDNAGAKYVVIKSSIKRYK
jgi:hypothetical protein